MHLTKFLAMSTITNGTNGIISPPAKWTADELMHGKEGVSEDHPASLSPGSPMKKSNRFSMRKLGGKKSPADPMDWGMPGHLSEEEVAIFVSASLLILILGLVLKLLRCHW